MSTEELALRLQQFAARVIDDSGRVVLPGWEYADVSEMVGAANVLREQAAEIGRLREILKYSGGALAHGKVFVDAEMERRRPGKRRVALQDVLSDALDAVETTLRSAAPTPAPGGVRPGEARS